MNNKQTALTKEHRLIEAIKAWTGEGLIGDDCAVLPGQMLVTSDSLVEKTHFLLPGISFGDLGWKSIAVNLSDIAAMGGVPRFLTVSLTIPQRIAESQVEEIFLSMVDCARTYRARIIGGDLTRGDILVICVTVLGETHEAGCLLRSGAQASDIVIVTGNFGASAAGLWLMQKEMAGYPYCLKRHFRPEPRLKDSWLLVEKTGGRGALMDASDGLADALWQIARASGCGMQIDASAIPIHNETIAVSALAGKEPLDLALYGGEDYELVGCLAPPAWAQLQELPDNPFVAIGTVDSGKSVSVIREDGREQELDLACAFQHFQ